MNVGDANFDALLIGEQKKGLLKQSPLAFFGSEFERGREGSLNRGLAIDRL